MSENDPIDTSQYRQAIWEKEYSYRKNLPSSNTDIPSRPLRTFFETYPKIDTSAALDVGSGNGRNSIFLAEKGFKKVLGIEFSHIAMTQALHMVAEKQLQEQIRLVEQSLGLPVPSGDEEFSLVIDMMTMHALTEKDRAVYVSEINRVTKPNGYFVFYTIAADSPAAIDLMEKFPGPEENSYRFKVDDDVIIEKAFTKKNLEEMFSSFELLSLDAQEQFTPAFGDIYKRVYYYGVMRKRETNVTIPSFNP